MDNQEQTAANLAAPLSAHEATKLLIAKRTKVNQYAKVEPNTLYYRALGAIYAVPDTDVNRAAIEAVGGRVLPYKEGGVVGNAKFAITSKSGSSVVVEAKNYNEAQKIADRKYGKGCIVDLVGNACKNSTVANAIAWKLGVNNSVANARFKVGDRVRSISGRGSYGTIKAIEYGDECIVDWDNGMGSRTPADGLKLANSSGAVANAWPSSYKVGDRIKFESRTASGHGVVGMERGYSPSIRSMRTGVITKDLGRGKWEVKTSDGSIIQGDESDFMGLNSTNPVLNAVTDWEKVYTIKGLPVKLVYRGEPYYDIKATVEGGNMTYVPLGRYSMNNPPDQSGAEKMVAPHWSKVKRTVRNAEKEVVNAKFKVGDEVKIIGTACSTRGKKATVVKIDSDGYMLTIPGVGMARGYDEEDLKAINSHNPVVNAAMEWKKAANFQPLPSFKVGQKVKFWDRNQAAYYDGIYSVKKVLNPYEVELEGSDGKMRPGNKCDVRRIVAA